MRTTSLPPTLPSIERRNRILIIEPNRGVTSLQLAELWHRRELLWFLMWRDVKVRYKQTLLGATWAILQPVLTMVVFSFFFGRLARIASDGIPYPLFSLAGLVPWTFFANGVSHAAESVVASSNLIKKVYFPRVLVPLAAIVSGFADFALAFMVLIGMAIYYQVPLGINLLLIPVFLCIEFAAALGLGLSLCALNVRYRDVRYVIPFLIQMLLFITPIAYPSSLLSESWRVIYGINPMVGVVEGFRFVMFSKTNMPISMFVVSTLSAGVLLTLGMLHFKRVERKFADIA